MDSQTAALMGQMANLLGMVRRVEHKLDTLIAALAKDDDESLDVTSLDGKAFAARDTSKSLG